MGTVNREELAWAAGFFDGEGCTMATGLGKRWARISITQVDREVLDRFHRATFGLGEIYGPYGYVKGQPQLRYTLYGRPNVQAVIAALWPWLGTVKREQARRVLPGTRWPQKNSGLCRNGHDWDGNRNRWNQCVPCLLAYNGVAVARPGVVRYEAVS